METMLYVLDLFGIVVFAVTGSMAAGKKRMDLFGVIVLAAATALGGGTFRDLILGAHPIFWVSEPVYLAVVVVSAIATFFLVRLRSLPNEALLVGDALGLAVFTVIGLEKALDMGVSPAIAVVMGLMTAVFGGIVRDVLSGEIPLILRREIYATASLCGAIAYVGIFLVFGNPVLAVLVSIAITLGLRLSAIKWKISLPLYVSRENNGPDGPDE